MLPPLHLTGDGACHGPSVYPAGALWALIKVSTHGDFLGKPSRTNLGRGGFVSADHAV